MELFFSRGERRFYRQAITRASAFVWAFNERPYPCLLWTHSSPLPPNERAELAERLVASQCRYAVCGGQECEALHDDIDSAYIRPLLDPATIHLPRPMLMTTWHEGESYAEVASFFVLNTNFAEHDFREFLVVHIGGTSAEHGALEAAVRNANIGEAAV
jgi:hypothetical protein